MFTIFNIILFFTLLLFIYSTFLSYRNLKVYKYRIYKLYNSTINEYIKLPSYEYMLFNIFYKLEIPNE